MTALPQAPGTPTAIEAGDAGLGQSVRAIGRSRPAPRRRHDVALVTGRSSSNSPPGDTEDLVLAVGDQEVDPLRARTAQALATIRGPSSSRSASRRASHRRTVPPTRYVVRAPNGACSIRAAPDVDEFAQRISACSQRRRDRATSRPRSTTVTVYAHLRARGDVAVEAQYVVACAAAPDDGVGDDFAVTPRDFFAAV